MGMKFYYSAAANKNERKKKEMKSWVGKKGFDALKIKEQLLGEKFMGDETVF